jgi:hypothetical protein
VITPRCHIPTHTYTHALTHTHTQHRRNYNTYY